LDSQDKNTKDIHSDDDNEHVDEIGYIKPDNIPMIPGFEEVSSNSTSSSRPVSSSQKYVAYTIKLPADQLAALQSIWLELKRLYGAHSPDKSGMIQPAVQDWLKRWDGPDRQKLLNELLEIREDTRRRQYKKN